jgi:hypothetical protein
MDGAGPVAKAQVDQAKRVVSAREIGSDGLCLPANFERILVAPRAEIYICKVVTGERIVRR